MVRTEIGGAPIGRVSLAFLALTLGTNRGSVVLGHWAESSAVASQDRA